MRDLNADRDPAPACIPQDEPNDSTRGSRGVSARPHRVVRAARNPAAAAVRTRNSLDGQPDQFATQHICGPGRRRAELIARHAPYRL